MSRKFSLRSLLVVLAAIGPHFSVETSHAQTPAATLTGTIQDQTGALLPNVTVTVVDVDRNVSQSTRSNEMGSFAIPALRPSNYSLVAELAGFKKFVQQGIVLQVSQVARIDIRL